MSFLMHGREARAAAQYLTSYESELPFVMVTKVILNVESSLGPASSSGLGLKTRVMDTSLELLRPNLQVLLVSKARPSNHLNLLSPSLLVPSYLTHFSFSTPSRTVHTWVSKCWTRIRFLKYHLNNTTLLLKNLHELLIVEENCQ